MLTPKELSAQKFDKVLMWGYDMTAVDSFLEQVEADYTTLYEENSSLTNQLKTLSDKLDEYRKKVETANRLPFQAEPFSDTVVIKSSPESQRDTLLAELTYLTEQVAAEKRRLEDARNATRTYIDHILSRYASEEKYLSNLRDRDMDISAPQTSIPKTYPVSEPTIVSPAPEKPVSDFTRAFPPFDLKDTRIISPETTPVPPAKDIPTEDFSAEAVSDVPTVQPLPKSEEFLNPFWEDLWDTDTETEASQPDTTKISSGEFTEDLAEEITLPNFSMSASPRPKPTPSSSTAKPLFEFSKLSLSDFIQKFGNNSNNGNNDNNK